MCLMIMFKVTKTQRLTLYPQNTVSEKEWEGGRLNLSHFRVDFFQNPFMKFHFFLATKKRLRRDSYMQMEPFVHLVQKQSFADVLKNRCSKNFAITRGKHLCWSLFLLELQAFRLNLLL